MPSMQAQLLSKIHQINQLEIKAGRLAQKNSSNFKVRAFGRRLVIDHSAADRKVLHFARANHIVLMTPQPQNAQQQQQMQNTMATMQRLQTLKGNAFDMQFLQFMQKGHDNAIQMLAQKEKMLPPSGLKSMIKDMIPILTQHYEIAVNLKIRDTAGGMAGGY